MNRVTPGFPDVDLITILVAYLLISYGETGAGIFAFGQGILIDIFSTGLLGFFVFLYLIVFFGINIGSRFFDLHSSRGLIILVSLAVLLKEILFMSLLSLFYHDIFISTSVFLAFATSVICSGLIAPFLFYLLDQINHLFMREMQETS